VSATLPRPGSVVIARTTPPPRVIPTDTGVWFVAGLTDRGRSDRPQLIQSLSDFIAYYGARQTYSVLYDALELFFRDGGSRAYVGRVVGPAATTASKNLNDAGAAVSLVARAKGPGAFANGITIQIQNPGAGGTAGSFSLLITDPAYPQANGTTASYSEQSPDFTTQAAAVAWAGTQSQLLDLSLGASANLPAAAAAAPMAGGADDRVNVTDAQWVNALNLFTRDLGPGQVTQIGRVTNQAYLDTLAHAALNNRTAILDLPDSPVAATLTALTIGLRTSPNAKYGAAFGPWVQIPGLVPGSPRIVPPSALVCARINAKDGSGSTPNAPAAGSDGIARSVVALSQPAYTSGTLTIDQTRDDMYAKGVNQIVSRYGVFEVFGWRTLVDPAGADQDWINLGNTRLAMYIVAQALRIAEGYVLDELDGRGRTFKAFEGDIRGVLLDLYGRGSLYDGGSGRPEDAFSVDTGPTVNTPATIANRELHAAISVRMAQDAELVVIEVAKVPITTSL
jgi:hypothetical protein